MYKGYTLKTFGLSLACSGFGPRLFFSGTLKPGRAFKKNYARLEMPIPSFRGTGDCSEKFNLYSRQIILPRKTKSYATYSLPRNLYRLSPRTLSSSPLGGCNNL